MNTSKQTIPIYLVDDDRDFSEALSLYLVRSGYKPLHFESSEQFLAYEEYAEVACILMDKHLPGLSGLQAQQELAKRGVELPIVFMSGESGYQDVVDAVKSGAITFLEKPFTMAQLQAAIVDALAAHEAKLAELSQARSNSLQLDSLTSREREIYNFGIKGYSIKRIAEDLDITTSTVEFHRSNVLKKLKVNSFAELMARELDNRN